MNNTIEIKNVTKKYNQFKLDNITITLPSGTIMGFIGENGAGKSTTIKLILDIIKKDSGQIKVLGYENTKNQKKWKNDVGVVMDESSFSDNLSGKEVNLIMKNTYKNWDENTFFEYLKKFDLLENKLIKEYSRGMKMKLSIAVALSHNAKLLILDEATSGLDPIVRDEILDVFLEFMQDENHSILMSSHILSDLEKVCDIITFIHKGKIIFSMPKDDIIEKYGILKCSLLDFEQIDKSIIKGVRQNSFGVEALIEKSKYKGELFVDRASIEDVMIFIVREKK